MLMAMMMCSECGKDVSSKATACPGCGAPIAGSGSGTPVQTIEKTAKQLKVHQLISSIMFVGGLLWTIIAIVAINKGSGSTGSTIVPIIICALGMGWYIRTRVSIWWHHE
jgi:uncharacterized membrane protein YvbJ